MKRKARQASRLRRKAEQHAQSPSQAFLDEVTAATSGCESSAEFSDLVGRWTPDPAFDAIIASQRQIDLEKWN
jgi:hypothetical protein